MSLSPLGILETSLYVSDLTAAESFYRDVLGLTVHSRHAGRHCFFRCGNGMLLLFDAHASLQSGDLPPHGAVGPGHVAFAIADEALEAWRTRLQTYGIPIELEMAWPQGGVSLYFRDPSGNSLEVATPRIWNPMGTNGGGNHHVVL